MSMDMVKNKSIFNDEDLSNHCETQYEFFPIE